MQTIICLRHQAYKLVVILFLISCSNYKEIAVNSMNCEERIEAINSINNQEELKEVFRNNLMPHNSCTNSVRIAVIKKIQDQDFLKEIVKTFREGSWGAGKSIREAAIKNITDQDFLKMLFYNDSFYNVDNDTRRTFLNRMSLQRIIVKAIKDQDILFEIANNYRVDESIKETVVELIKDENYLKEIVRNAFYISVRESALEKINDHDFLKEIAENIEINYTVRIKAFNRIKDPDLNFMLRLIKNDVPYLTMIKDDVPHRNDIRVEVVKRIKDQSILLMIAKGINSKEIYGSENIFLGYSCQKVAISKLNNLEALIEIAQATSGHRAEAARRVQCLLNGNTCGNFYSYSKGDFHVDDLVVFLLEPEIIERHGLIRLDITYQQERARYKENHHLTVINFTIKLFNTEEKMILDKEYIAIPPKYHEEFDLWAKRKTRKAKLDYDELRRLLLNM